MMYILALVIIGSVLTTTVDDSPLSHCMGTVVESYENYGEAIKFCNKICDGKKYTEVTVPGSKHISEENGHNNLI